MSPIFPKRAARQADIADPSDFNEDLLPAVEKIGALDQHDFTGSDLKANLTPASGVYYNPYWAFTEVDPEFGTLATGYTYPSSTLPADAVRVTSVSDWTVLETRTMTTGVSTLWIQAWGQYIEHEWGAGYTLGHVVTGREATHIEFAIRVDGRVIELSITSEYDRYGRHPMAVRATDQYQFAAGSGKNRLPGPIVPNANSGPGFGPETHPVRVSAAVSVNPGNHVVEFVARRVNPPDRRLYLSDFVAIYNRNLFVLDCPIYPAVAPSRSPLEVAGFEDGTAISATEMYTDRYAALETRYNAIQEGDLARGALNNRHLPGTLIDKVQVTIEPSGAQSSDNVYPGFSATTVFTPLRAAGAQGWYILDEAFGGKKLQTNSGAHAGFGIAGVNCYLVIQADIQLIDIFDNHAGLDVFAHFVLFYQQSGGAPTALPATIGFTNRFQYYDFIESTGSSTGVQTDEHTNISLFYVLDFSKGGTHDIDFIGVAAAGLNLDLGVSPGPLSRYQWRRASLSVLQLRA